MGQVFGAACGLGAVRAGERTAVGDRAHRRRRPLPWEESRRLSMSIFTLSMTQMMAHGDPRGDGRMETLSDEPELTQRQAQDFRQLQLVPGTRFRHAPASAAAGPRPGRSAPTAARSRAGATATDRPPPRCAAARRWPTASIAVDQSRPRLHLDDQHEVAAPGDQVDLAELGACSAAPRCGSP